MKYEYLPARPELLSIRFTPEERVALALLLKVARCSLGLGPDRPFLERMLVVLEAPSPNGTPEVRS